MSHASYHASYHTSYHASYHASYHTSYHASYHATYHTSYHASYHTSYYAGRIIKWNEKLSITALQFVLRAFLALLLLLTKTTAAKCEVALSYDRVRGLYFLALIFVAAISIFLVLKLRWGTLLNLELRCGLLFELRYIFIFVVLISCTVGATIGLTVSFHQFYRSKLCCTMYMNLITESSTCKGVLQH